MIGRGFFPTVALLNHSCDANTTRVFHQDTQVVRAARPIKRGEQIFAGYGPDYGGMERFHRQKVLRGKFFFRCMCEPCENMWPLATATLGVVPEFLRQQPNLQLLKEVRKKSTFVFEKLYCQKINSFMQLARHVCCAGCLMRMRTFEKF